MSANNTSPGLSSLTSGRFRRDSQLMALLTLTSVIGFILNIAALSVLLQKRNRHTATHLYLVNLAIANILMCVIVVPLRIVHLYNVFWWTRASCIIYVVIRYTPLFVGMNTVVLIAIERCVAVALPAKFAAFASRSNVKIQLALVWLTALVEMIYPFAIVNTAKLGVKNYCTIGHLKSSYFYTLSLMVAVPSAFLVVAYGTIIVTVLRRQWNGRANVEIPSSSNMLTDDPEQASSDRRSNGRLVIMCAIIAVLIMVCWMPSYIYRYMLQYYHVSRKFVRYVHVVVYFHPVVSPLVYFFFDARFRSWFTRLFRCRKVQDMSVDSLTLVDAPFA
ncbi:hypothetical protein LSAT2_018680 [Lamellibrachia satsuma]|nr:hypothetical protein LSAT2_018680 [Lamellibrachia satsuma]